MSYRSYRAVLPVAVEIARIRFLDGHRDPDFGGGGGTKAASVARGINEARNSEQPCDRKRRSIFVQPIGPCKIQHGGATGPSPRCTEFTVCKTKKNHKARTLEISITIPLDSGTQSAVKIRQKH